MIASRERLLVALVAAAGVRGMDARNASALVESANTIADAACEAWGHERRDRYADGDCRGWCRRCGAEPIA